MRRLSTLTLFSLLLAVASACNLGAPVCEDPIGCVTVEPGEPIAIASALALDGPDAQLGLDSQYGVEIAIEDYGAIHDHDVITLPEDSGCTEARGSWAKKDSS
jgi:ABC-type branched-subunit amino acid transport system substrate-binding protein